MKASVETTIRRCEVSAYRIPTERPESDGTFEWNATTLVVVELLAGDTTGLGYTYADTATARLVHDHLAPIVIGRDAMEVSEIWRAMVRSVRNLGRPGLASMAIAAVDTALWDVKARVLGVPLAALFGMVRESVPVYYSGGFTSYPANELSNELRACVDTGFSMVKMKIGRDVRVDVERARIAREAIGNDVELFVDANGAYTRREAVRAAIELQQFDVRWFEEPVSSDDLAGLRFVREHAPPAMAIAAGEYGYDLVYFRRMLESEAVDVLQADATRCAGITELLHVDALCEAFHVPLSTHTAPSLHLHPCLALGTVGHVEYFHDHVCIERMLFDGVAIAKNGKLAADLSRPGNGLEFKWKDAERFAVKF